MEKENFAQQFSPVEYTINVKGQLLDLSKPCVMGILNVTPDSFYADSRMQTEAEIYNRTNQIIAEGAKIISQIYKVNNKEYNIILADGTKLKTKSNNIARHFSCLNSTRNGKRIWCRYYKRCGRR